MALQRCMLGTQTPLRCCGIAQPLPLMWRHARPWTLPCRPSWTTSYVLYLTKEHGTAARAPVCGQMTLCAAADPQTTCSTRYTCMLCILQATSRAMLYWICKAVHCFHKSMCLVCIGSSLQVYMGCRGRLMGYGIRAASRSVGTSNFGVLPSATSLGAAGRR